MEKIRVTAQQRANAVEALTVMWPSVPKKNVYPDLNKWEKDAGQATSCGTIACFGGWACRWPAFQDQGAEVSKYGEPLLHAGKHNYADGERNELATHLFGDGLLFLWRQPHERGTDHAIVSKRLRKLIRESVVV